MFGARKAAPTQRHGLGRQSPLKGIERPKSYGFANPVVLIMPNLLKFSTIGVGLLASVGPFPRLQSPFIAQRHRLAPIGALSF